MLYSPEYVDTFEPKMFTFVLRNKSGPVELLASLSSGTTVGTYKALNKTDEEQRNLSTKVSVDLVVTQVK